MLTFVWADIRTDGRMLSSNMNPSLCNATLISNHKLNLSEIYTKEKLHRKLWHKHHTYFLVCDLDLVSAAAAECCQLFCSHIEVTLVIREQPKGWAFKNIRKSKKLYAKFWRKMLTLVWTDARTDGITEGRTNGRKDENYILLDILRMPGV